MAHHTPLANCGLDSLELRGKNLLRTLLVVFSPLVELTPYMYTWFNIYSVAAVSPRKRSKKSKKRGANEVPQAQLRSEKRVSSGLSAISSNQASLVPFVNSVVKSVRDPAKGMNPIEQLQRSYAQAVQV